MAFNSNEQSPLTLTELTEYFQQMNERINSSIV